MSSLVNLQLTRINLVTSQLKMRNFLTDYKTTKYFRSSQKLFSVCWNILLLIRSLSVLSQTSKSKCKYCRYLQFRNVRLFLTSSFSNYRYINSILRLFHIPNRFFVFHLIVYKLVFFLFSPSFIKLYDAILNQMTAHKLDNSIVAKYL